MRIVVVAYLPVSLFLVLVLSFLLLASKTESNSEVQMISPEEMQQISKMDDVQLVDIRTPKEFKTGYIEGSQNIDYFSKTFNTDLEQLDKSKPVIVVCRSGRRSAKCSKKMIDAGFYSPIRGMADII